jgi:hypothetical protein
VDHIFLSYSHNDRSPVERIAAGLERRGFQVWWDRRLLGGQDFSVKIESMLQTSKCAVVAWSKAARHSLWVKAEANHALELGRLVQLTIDGSKPPLPFTALHLVDFSSNAGTIGNEPMEQLASSIHACSGTLDLAVPPDTRAVVGSQFAGFGRQVVVGGASLALILLAAALVALGSSRRFPIDAFGLASVAMFLVAVLGFGYMLTQVVVTYLASRR